MSSARHLLLPSLAGPPFIDGVRVPAITARIPVMPRWRALLASCALALVGEATARAEGPRAVAAFPDFSPAAAAARDAELLEGDPYDGARREAEAVSAATDEDLDVDPYGDQLLFVNPYTDDLAFANPYTDELLFADPYADQLLFANPYADDVALANPYTSFLSAPGVPRPPAAPAAPRLPALPAPGLLALDVHRAFRGLVFIDGVGVPAVTATIPVLPGRHTLVVYPQIGAPYEASVLVAAGRVTVVPVSNPATR